MPTVDISVVEVAPKDIHILVDYSLKGLINLRTLLDNMVFNYDGEDPTHVEAKAFLSEQLYPTVTNTIKELTNGS